MKQLIRYIRQDPKRFVIELAEAIAALIVVIGCIFIFYVFRP